MITEPEAFNDELKKNNSTMYVNIPFKLWTGNGWKKGDKVKVLIKRVK